MKSRESEWKAPAASAGGEGRGQWAGTRSARATCPALT